MGYTHVVWCNRVLWIFHSTTRHADQTNLKWVDAGLCVHRTMMMMMMAHSDNITVKCQTAGGRQYVFLRNVSMAFKVIPVCLYVTVRSEANHFILCVLHLTRWRHNGVASFPFSYSLYVNSSSCWKHFIDILLRMHWIRYKLRYFMPVETYCTKIELIINQYEINYSTLRTEWTPH